MPNVPKTYKGWKLVAYATNESLDPSKHLKLVEEPVPELQDGQILVKHDYLALEPTMRNSLSERESYQPPLPLGSFMWAFFVGKVVASKNADYKEGALVSGVSQMSDYSVLTPGKQRFQLVPDVSRPDGSKIDEREFFSAFGPPGLAAYVGLFSERVGNMKGGEVVLVDGAAGATGNFVIQMAKARGAKRIIGVASKRKEKAVLDAGADAFVAYDEPDFEKKLQEVTERKVDLLFENVGGKVLDAELTCMAPYSRVALCGVISTYDNNPAEATSQLSWRNLLVRRIAVHGFICGDPEVACGQQEGIMQLLKEGKIHSSFYDFQPGGIENVPQALLGLFKGINTGKMTVKL